MVLKTNNYLTFTSTNNFLNIIYNKQFILTKYNKVLVLCILNEDKNLGCILDDFIINNQFYLDITKYLDKYSYLSLLEGTFQRSKTFKFTVQKYKKYKFKENVFFNLNKKSLLTKNSNISSINTQCNFFLRKFIIYKPIKGGFLGYWLGFFGFLSKRSIIKCLKYYSKYFLNFLWYFILIFNYVKSLVNPVVIELTKEKKKKKKKKKLKCLKVSFKTIFSFK